MNSGKRLEFSLKCTPWESLVEKVRWRDQVCYFSRWWQSRRSHGVSVRFGARPACSGAGSCLPGSGRGPHPWGLWGRLGDGTVTLLPVKNQAFRWTPGQSSELLGTAVLPRLPTLAWLGTAGLVQTGSDRSLPISGPGGLVVVGVPVEEGELTAPSGSPKPASAVWTPQ